MAAKELKVKITADNKPLKAGLDDSKKQVNSFSGVVKKAGAALLGAFAARELLRGIKNTVVELGNMADRLLDLEQITGISTDRLQEYEQVARVAGVNSETLANAVQGLTQRMARGQTESSPLNLALKQLGINARTASGEMRNGADITEDAIDKLAKMENITERNVLGAMLFTGAWKDLAPVLALGADGIEAARKQAHELGLVMDKETLEAANKSRIALENFSATGKRLGQELAITLIPAVTGFANALAEAFAGLNGIVRLQKDIIKSENLSGWQKFTNFLKSTGMFGVKAQASAIVASLDEIKKGNEEVEQQRIDQEEAAAAAARQAEAERRWAIGKLGRLREDLAKAEADYTASQTQEEASRHLKRMNNIQAEIDLYEASVRGMVAAETQRAIPGSPQRMQALAPTAIPTEIYQQATLQQNIYNRALEEEAKAHEKARLASEKHADMMKSLKMIAEDSAYSIGEAFGQMAAKGGQATGALVAQAIAQSIAQLMRQIATTLPFPASLAALAGVGAFAGIMRSQIPAYADGAVAFGPTLGLMGEYANASTNPEIIAPLDKLQGMLGGGTGEVEFRIKGQELWGVLKKYENRLNQNS